MDILQTIQERLLFIEQIKSVFLSTLAPRLADRFPRGRVQKKLLKEFNLPVTGPNMRAVNEALEGLGYKKIILNGRSFFKKV